MYKEILVSVILPVHNTEKYITKCVDSIINQTYSNWELLIIDDGSTDESGKICREYAAKNSKINYIWKKCGGPSDARNRGIELAKGEYLYFLDSDDYCEPDLLKIAVEALEKYQVRLVSFGYYMEKKNSVTSICYGNGNISTEQAIASLLTDIKIENYLCNKVFDRKLFDNMKLPIGEIFEDMTIMYKLILECNSIAVLNKCLYHYQIRNDSLSHTPTVKQLLYYWEILLERGGNIEHVYPSQRENVAFSLVKGAIYIWNQMSKQCRSNQLKEYDFLIKDIRKNVSNLKKASYRYKLMGYLIYIMPYTYAKLVYLLKGKKNG